MILNKLEFLMMNNPIRNFIQKHLEIKRLRKLSDLSPSKTILEIGCGTGHGSKLIKKSFQAKRIYAIDLDKRMISIARKRNKDDSITFEVQDAASLKFKNKSFDAVFDLAVMHHIPNWKKTLEELKRVLKHNGQLIMEDFSIETFSTVFGRFLKKILDHPYETMYKEEEIVNHLRRLGFKIIHHKRYFLFLRYFIIVAQRQGN